MRNILAGVITTVTSDDAWSDLVAIDIGGVNIMARVTKAATRELVPGAWAARLGPGQVRLAARPLAFAAPYARRYFNRAPKMHDGHDVVVGLEAHRRLDGGVIGRAAPVFHITP